MQVYASYRYRRDLADAAKISGVFGRSRILKREEAIRQEVSMHTSHKLLRSTKHRFIIQASTFFLFQASFLHACHQS